MKIVPSKWSNSCEMKGQSRFLAGLGSAASLAILSIFLFVRDGMNVSALVAVRDGTMQTMLNVMLRHKPSLLTIRVGFYACIYALLLIH